MRRGDISCVIETPALFLRDGGRHTPCQSVRLHNKRDWHGLFLHWEIEVGRSFSDRLCWYNGLRWYNFWDCTLGNGNFNRSVRHCGCNLWPSGNRLDLKLRSSSSSLDRKFRKYFLNWTFNHFFTRGPRI
jgi:hypothetical protein